MRFVCRCAGGERRAASLDTRNIYKKGGRGNWVQRHKMYLNPQFCVTTLDCWGRGRVNAHTHFWCAPLGRFALTSCFTDTAESEQRSPQNVRWGAFLKRFKDLFSALCVSTQGNPFISMGCPMQKRVDMHECLIAFVPVTRTGVPTGRGFLGSGDNWDCSLLSLPKATKTNLSSSQEGTQAAIKT